MKSYNQKDYAAPEVLVQDLGPDRAQIAAIFAHALLSKGATKSVIAKEAVEMADELIKELGK